MKLGFRVVPLSLPPNAEGTLRATHWPWINLWLWSMPLTLLPFSTSETVVFIAPLSRTLHILPSPTLAYYYFMHHFFSLVSCSVHGMVCYTCGRVLKKYGLTTSWQCSLFIYSMYTWTKTKVTKLLTNLSFTYSICLYIGPNTVCGEIRFFLCLCGLVKFKSG